MPKNKRICPGIASITMAALLVCIPAFYPSIDYPRDRQFSLGPGLSFEEGLKSAKRCAASWAVDCVLIGAYATDSIKRSMTNLTNNKFWDGRTDLWRYYFRSGTKGYLSVQVSWSGDARAVSYMPTSDDYDGIRGSIIDSAEAAEISYDLMGWHYLRFVFYLELAMYSLNGIPVWHLSYYYAWDGVLFWVEVYGLNGKYISSWTSKNHWEDHFR